MSLVFLVALLAAAVLNAPAAEAAPGDHVSSADFALTAANASPTYIAWNGSHLLVVDTADNRTYAYSIDGTYDSSGGFTYTNSSEQGLASTGSGYYLIDRNNRVIQAYNASGAATSGSDVSIVGQFGLLQGDNVTGITYDAQYLRVVDNRNNRILTYTTGGSHLSGNTFSLASGNTNSYGMTWDGDFLRVLDTSDDKVYSYTRTGTYVAAADFDVGSSTYGIAWDGSNYRATDITSDRIRAYEGIPQAPYTNYGLPADTSITYAGTLAGTVTAAGSWRCISSAAGETITINNASLMVHGFCAQPSGSGLEVELHIAPSANFADLSRFVNATGHWRFVEQGVGTAYDMFIYEDTYSDGSDLAFTESSSGLADSERLGFSTKAKSVTSSSCSEADASFACDTTAFSLLSPNDSAVLLFSLDASNTAENAGQPSTPASLIVTRSADYATATLTWTSYDTVVEYEIQRLTAVTVSVGDSTRIEYGDPAVFTLDSPVAGVATYADSSLEAHRTYQYRIRARGATDDSWSAWSEYVFSGAAPQVDIPPPGNVHLARDSSAVLVSWAAPPGTFDNYTVQRQELVETPPYSPSIPRWQA